MNTILLLFCWGVYLFTALYTLHRQRLDVAQGLRLGILYFILLPMAVILIMGSAPSPHPGIPEIHWQRDTHNLAIVLSMIAVYGICDLVKEYFSGRTPQQAAISVVSGHLRLFSPAHLLVVYILASATVFVMAGMASGRAHWAQSRSDLMESGFGAQMLLLAVGAIRVAILIIVGVRLMWAQMAILSAAIVLGVACLVDLYTTGNRIFTLQAVFVVGVILLVQRQYKLISILAVLAIPFGYAMTVFPVVRSHMHNFQGVGVTGAINGFLRAWERATTHFGYDLGFETFILGITEAINLNILVAIPDVFPADRPYLHGMTYLKLFVFWIPRSLWPTKPESPTMIAGEYFMPGTGTSLVTTVFGELYMNFGWFGVALLPFGVHGLWLCLKSAIPNGRAAAIAGLIFGFTVTRMAFADMVFLFAVVVLLLRFCKIESTGERWYRIFRFNPHPASKQQGFSTGT